MLNLESRGVDAHAPPRLVRAGTLSLSIARSLSLSFCFLAAYQSPSSLGLLPKLRTLIANLPLRFCTRRTFKKLVRGETNEERAARKTLEEYFLNTRDNHQGLKSAMYTIEKNRSFKNGKALMERLRLEPIEEWSGSFMWDVRNQLWAWVGSEHIGESADRLVSGTSFA